MKMKNLRKMVSVILCAVISCMCLVSPVSAAENAAVMPTAVGDYGIVQVQAYPVVYNENTGRIEKQFTPASTSYYSGGAILVNLTIDPVIQAIYRDNNCNRWVFRIRYAADGYTKSIKFKYISGVETLESSISTQTNGYKDIGLEENEIKNMKYELAWTFKDGTVFTAAGHVNY